MSKKFWLFKLITFILVMPSAHSQSLKISAQTGLRAQYYIQANSRLWQIAPDIPLLSFLANGKIHNTLDAKAQLKEGKYYFQFDDGISGELIPEETAGTGWKAVVTIFNNSPDTIDIENIVPFGESDKHPYLTSSGPWNLARSKIFRPGLGPIGVILPDNAWELGYASMNLGDEFSICALARRTLVKQGSKRRYRTIVFPGGSVEYTIHLEEFNGVWQNGLKKVFRDKYLYDLDTFDNTLFEREDLQWIRHDYIIGLEFAWNKDFYDWKKGEYHYYDFLEKGKKLFGGYDVFGIWPTWPRLGVDQRNQWDLFADLPGGLEQLKKFSEEGKKLGTRFFICFNPWDESTREENPYQGMARLIKETDADGVVLDTRGASSLELQHAADSVKPGVVMYSEGMAVTKDMPGIVSGRVHDAIYLPPPLNLNKLIKPEFAIFRVCQVHDGRIRREASIAFFNGYGTELNTFAPGQVESMEEDLMYLGKTSQILRENTSSFLAHDWTPLITGLHDSIWVNEWPLENKTVYTILSLNPEGYEGPQFEVKAFKDHHLVSLWHHEEIIPDTLDGKLYARIKVDAFNKFDLGTRTEGNVDCIALLPSVISATVDKGILKVQASKGEKMKIWAGEPSYQNENFITVQPNEQEIKLMDHFGSYEGKFVLQLFNNEELLDETIVYLEPGTPRLISKFEKTAGASQPPEGMVLIPAGVFEFMAGNTDQFIPYPVQKKSIPVKMSSYYMDKYPVTNREYYEFIQESNYKTADTSNYLKHWKHGKYPEELRDHPVVYVSLADAQAYAHWAGKRLPTETEWQYAAQGNDGRKWPWGNEFLSRRCNNALGHSTAVKAFPKGRSPFGIYDMVGNVWQFTQDVYDNGTYYFVMMKGGSFYKPTSSWWYVKGGPQPADWQQLLLLVSPGFDRNSTLGFRCVKDRQDNP